MLIVQDLWAAQRAAEMAKNEGKKSSIKPCKEADHTNPKYRS